MGSYGDLVTQEYSYILTSSWRREGRSVTGTTGLQNWTWGFHLIRLLIHLALDMSTS